MNKLVKDSDFFGIGQIIFALSAALQVGLALGFFAGLLTYGIGWFLKILWTNFMIYNRGLTNVPNSLDYLPLYRMYGVVLLCYSIALVIVNFIYA